MIIPCRLPVGPGRCVWGSADGVQPYAFWAPSRKHGMTLSKSSLSAIFFWRKISFGLSNMVLYKYS